MAIIPQPELDLWQDIENTPELERLIWLLNILPDEKLMRKLEAHRKNGRDDYPVRYMWNLMVAREVFGFSRMTDFHRELMRNPTLVKLCGAPLSKTWDRRIPPIGALYRFWHLLQENETDIREIFYTMLREVKQYMPEFGKYTAVDSTVVESAGKPVTNKEKQQIRDGRRELDARWGKKTYTFADGSESKEISFFGFKLHVMVDTTYDMPIAYYVTPANESDAKHLLPLVEQSKQHNPEVIEDTEAMMADRGYDSEDNNKVLWHNYDILPVIDKRTMWKEDKGKTRPLYTDKVDTIVYDESGHLHCVCPATNEVRRMAFQGFEKDRGTLKFRCPAAAYGFECKGRQACEANVNLKSDFGRVVRVPIDKDIRRFSPVLKGTQTWQRLYNKRSSVERFNYRMKSLLNFDDHNFRGITNIQLKASMAILTMSGMFLARIKANDSQNLRSFYAPFPLAA
jgi:hypothetical protein